MSPSAPRRSSSRCACCGASITRPYGDLWDRRLDAYCHACATARCDAYPGECPKVYGEPVDA